MDWVSYDTNRGKAAQVLRGELQAARVTARHGKNDGAVTSPISRTASEVDRLACQRQKAAYLRAHGGNKRDPAAAAAEPASMPQGAKDGSKGVIFHEPKVGETFFLRTPSGMIYHDGQMNKILMARRHFQGATC